MKAKMLAHRIPSALWMLVLLAGLALPGCAAIGQSTPEALPTVVLDGGGATVDAGATVDGGATVDAGATVDGGASVDGGATVDGGASVDAGASSGVAASGIVVPADQAQVAFSTGGNILAVRVVNGEVVQAGQVLVSLAGSQKLNAAVKAASLELLSAQQALDTLVEEAGQARAQAMLRLAQANDALDQAEKHRGWKEYRVGDDDQIAVARADLIVAEDTLKKAQEVYGGFADSPEDNLNKAAALSAIAAARKARDRAQANLNYLLSLPQPLEVAKADAELEVARAEAEAAQRAYDKVKDGVAPDALALAQARVDNAQAQLAAAQAALADLDLKAPFDGMVSKLTAHGGEWVMPGQQILVLASLNQLEVQTTDLSERDVPFVSVGQAVSVRIKALNQTVTGRVSEISPLADTLGGDVVYQTRITLDEQPANLRAGMSVEVDFK